jgi:hypothetical protein
MARQNGTWVSYSPADPSMSPSEARIESVFSNEIAALRFGQGTRRLSLFMQFGETLEQAIARETADTNRKAHTSPTPSGPGAGRTPKAAE